MHVQKVPIYYYKPRDTVPLTLVWQTENLRAGGLPEVRPARHHRPHHRHHRSRHQRYSQGIKLLSFNLKNPVTNFESFFTGGHSVQNMIFVVVSFF
jgi:hypothetical protein